MSDKTVDLEALGSIRDRLTEYLAVGGFFNPDLMDHAAVSRLILDARNSISDFLALARKGLAAPPEKPAAQEDDDCGCKVFHEEDCHLAAPSPAQPTPNHKEAARWALDEYRRRCNLPSDWYGWIGLDVIERAIARTHAAPAQPAEEVRRLREARDYYSASYSRKLDDEAKALDAALALEAQLAAARSRIEALEEALGKLINAAERADKHVKGSLCDAIAAACAIFAPAVPAAAPTRRRRSQ